MSGIEIDKEKGFLYENKINEKINEIDINDNVKFYTYMDTLKDFNNSNKEQKDLKKIKIYWNVKELLSEDDDDDDDGELSEYYFYESDDDEDDDKFNPLYK